MSNTIFENEFLDIQEKDGYISINDRDSVQVFCYDSSTKKILVRKEVRPLWNIDPYDGLSYCALTGTIEEGDSVSKTVMKELYEEAGIYCNDFSKFLNLGVTYKSKFQSSRQFNYAFDCNGMKCIKPIGDGSNDESKSKNFWLDSFEVFKLKDQNFATSLYKLEKLHQIYL